MSAATVEPRDTTYIHWFAPEGKVFGTFAREWDDQILLGLGDTVAAAITHAEEDARDQDLVWENAPEGLVSVTPHVTYTIKMLPVRREPAAARSPLTPPLPTL